MKLERRFRWDDLESIYKAVVEDECERAPEGRVRFTAIRVDGTVFVGVGYPSTVADMVDTKTSFWKLEANPKNPKNSRVVEAGAPPLAVKRSTLKKASLSEAE